MFGALLARADVTARRVLGEVVRYTSGSGARVDVAGIYDALYVKVDAEHTGASLAGPAVFLTLSDLPSDPETDGDCRVTVRGEIFEAREIQKDGQGGVLLMLRRM
jgi:hypothetical protein